MIHGHCHTEWVGFCTLLRKEISRFLRIWGQSLIPPVITTVLYFIIFGRLIGQHVEDMDGHPYVQFIVPGLIMMQVITNSYANVSSSFFGAKFGRHIEELLVSPLGSNLILAGYIAGGVARGILCGALVTLIALLFTHLSIHHVFLMLFVVLLTSVLFSLAGFLNGLYAQKFDDITLIPTFVLTPLTYLGGVFYSIDLLPSFWQKMSMLNPILYMVNGFRYSMLGVSDMPVGIALGVLCGLTALLYLLAFQLLERGIGLRH